MRTNSLQNWANMMHYMHSELFNPQFRHLLVKQPALNPKDSGSFCLVAVCLVERRLQKTLLNFPNSRPNSPRGREPDPAKIRLIVNACPRIECTPA